MTLVATVIIAYLTVGAGVGVWSLANVRNSTKRDRLHDTLFVAVIMLLWPGPLREIIKEGM